MKSKFLTQLFTGTPLTVVGLLLFFAAFCAVVAWVFLRKGAKEHYDDIAKMPISGEVISYERR